MFQVKLSLILMVNRLILSNGLRKRECLIQNYMTDIEKGYRQKKYCVKKTYLRNGENMKTENFKGSKGNRREPGFREYCET